MYHSYSQRLRCARLFTLSLACIFSAGLSAIAADPEDTDSDDTGLGIGFIKLGDVNVTGRERSMIRRFEEYEFLQKKIVESEEVDFEAVDVAYDFQYYFSLLVDLKLKLDRQLAVQDLSQEEQASLIENRMKVESLRNQILQEQLQNDLAAVREADSGTPEGSSPEAASSVDTTSLEATIAALKESINALDESIKELTPEGSESENKFLPELRKPRSSTTKKNPIDALKDELTYRNFIRAQQRKVMLDDTHDLLGNKIYDLNFPLTLSPPDDLDSIAVITVRVETGFDRGKGDTTVPDSVMKRDYENTSADLVNAANNILNSHGLVLDPDISKPTTPNNQLKFLHNKSVDTSAIFDKFENDFDYSPLKKFVDIDVQNNKFKAKPFVQVRDTLWKQFYDPESSKPSVRRIEPEEVAQSVSFVSASQEMLNFTFMLDALLPAFGANANVQALEKQQRLIDTIERNPIAVSFVDGENRFGWFIRPRYKINDTGELIKTQAIFTHQFEVSIVVPGYVPYVNVYIESAEWVGQEELRNHLSKRGTSKKLNIQSRSTSLGDDKIKFKVGKREPIYVELAPEPVKLFNRIMDTYVLTYRKPKIKKVIGSLIAGSSIKQKLIILGDNLWKEPKVFVGNIEASSIEYLPDLEEGIVAVFEEIKDYDESYANGAPVTVATSIGIDSNFEPPVKILPAKPKITISPFLQLGETSFLANAANQVLIPLELTSAAPQLPPQVHATVAKRRTPYERFPVAERPLTDGVELTYKLDAAPTASTEYQVRAFAMSGEKEVNVLSGSGWIVVWKSGDNQISYESELEQIKITGKKDGDKLVEVNASQGFRLLFGEQKMDEILKSKDEKRLLEVAYPEFLKAVEAGRLHFVVQVDDTNKLIFSNKAGTLDFELIKENTTNMNSFKDLSKDTYTPNSFEIKNIAKKDLPLFKSSMVAFDIEIEPANP